MLDNCFQLGLILSDIDENVIPNIREEKDKVLEIMRLLPRIEKEKMTQEKTRELLIGKYKELISNLSNHDNVCNKMSESIREGRLDYILCMEHESMVNGYHIEDIELSYYVRDVISPIKELILEEQEKVYKNKYKRKVVSEDEITNLIDFIVDAEGIEKANEFVEQLKEYYPKADEFRINAEQTKEPYLMTLENKAKNYYLAHGDEYEVKSAYRKTYPYQEQLLLAIEDLPERVYNDPNACEEVSQTIVCFKDQKEIKDYDDITERPKKNSSSRPPLLSRNYDNVAKIFSHVTGNYRGNGRAIIFQFEPSEKVIEGLKEAYNLGSSFRVCLLVDGLSTAGANHDGYAPVVDRLIEGEYHDKIQNLANRLHDPNPNIPELISIIDFGLDLKDNIKSRLDSQKNRSDEESEMGAEGSSMQGNEGGVQR